MRAIGFAEAVAGAEIQESTHMAAEDVVDTLNSLLSAGFIECLPHSENIDVAELPATMFEVNHSYVHDIKAASRRF